MSEMPEVLKAIRPEQLVQLDVRPVVAGGTDPFQLIMEKLKSLGEGQVLQIINTFTPAPMIAVLQRQGFSSYTETGNDNRVSNHFYKNPVAPDPVSTTNVAIRTHWDEMLIHYNDNLVFVDVRDLEMPAPMVTILEKLDQLPEGKALFVYHRKLPVFILPELKERKFDYRINEIATGEVHLLIFRS